MNKQLFKLSSILTLLLFAATQLHADYSVSTISSGIVNDVNAGRSIVTINGQNYTYKLDEKGSMFALDEIEHVALKLNELTVGETYYFEKTSSEKDPKFTDFDGIIFISATPIKESEEYEKE